MHLLRLEKEPNSDRVDRSVTPPFVEEAASAVEMVEVGSVRFASPEIEACDLFTTVSDALRVYRAIGTSKLVQAWQSEVREKSALVYVWGQTKARGDVLGLAAVIRQPVHQVRFCEVLRVLFDELCECSL